MLMNGNDGDGLDDGPTVIGEYGGGEYGGGRIGMLMDGAPMAPMAPMALQSRMSLERLGFSSADGMGVAWR